MKISVRPSILKAFKIIGISGASLLLLLFLAPVVFPGKVAKEIIFFTNKKLDGEVAFSRGKLSFFRHFPTLTLTLYDFSLKGSIPYENDTLLVAKQIDLGVNLKRLLFNNEVKVNKIYVEDAFVNIKVNEQGKANYNVYVSDKSLDSTSYISIKLERIDLKNTHVKYSDLSLQILVDAKRFNYVGKGDLSESIFDLQTKMQIDSLNLYLKNEPYLINKQVNADLITNINTNSLAFVFKKNHLKINNFPIMFNGKLNFLKEGYYIDIFANSIGSKLEALFRAFPPGYVTWLERTKLRGQTDLQLTFKGNYNVSENIKPDLDFVVNIRDGFVQNDIAAIPASNIYVDLKAKMLGTNTDSLNIKIDSLFFNLGKDHLNAKVETKGIDNLFLKAKIKSVLDLATLDKALGIPDINMHGMLRVDIKADGVYNAKKRKFPVTDAKIDLRNGWIRTKYYPNPITDINIITNVVNTSGKYEDIKIDIAPASFIFENNPFNLTATLSNFDNIIYDIKANGEIEISKIYKIFSRKGLDLEGRIRAELSLKGKQSYAENRQYDKLQNRGTLEFNNIKTTSESFPKPFIIEHGILAFNQDKVWLKKFNVRYGQSDFMMNGYLQNVTNFIFSEGGILKGNFNLKSNFTNVDEFIFSKSQDSQKQKQTEGIKQVEAQNSENSGVIIIPPDLNLQLGVQADKIIYNNLDINCFEGNLEVNQGQAFLKKIYFNLIDCAVNMDASYKNDDLEKANFDFHIQAKDFDIKKAYNKIPMFREIVTTAEKAEGIISIDYNLKGVLKDNMKPVYSSLEGNGTISVSQVKFKGLKMFNVIGQKTGTEDIADPDISKVDIKTAIKNNVIAIDRFRARVSGFRLRIEGKTNLNGQLGLKIRLGLPPIGILGIPIVVAGTHKNPKVKIFSKSIDNVEETEYRDSTDVKKTEILEPLYVPIKDIESSVIKKDSVQQLITIPFNLRIY